MSDHNIFNEKALEELANRFFKDFPGSSRTQVFPAKGKAGETAADEGFGHSAFSAEEVDLPNNFTVEKHTDRQNAFKVNNPQTSLHDPFFSDGQIPKSVAGDGKSPLYSGKKSADSFSDRSQLPVLSQREQDLNSLISPPDQSSFNDYANFDTRRLQSDLPGRSFYDNQIPKSVSGDGSVPSHPFRRFPGDTQFSSVPKSEGSLTDFILSTEESYKKDYPGFDINNPPISFPDTAFYNGQIPKSVAGDGKLPGIVNNSILQSPAAKEEILPLSYQQQPGYKDLSGLLNEINHFRFQPQLPYTNGNTLYYFADPLTFTDNVRLGYPGIEPLRDTFPVVSNNSFDVDAFRKDFPILNEYVNGKRLVWLDNAATTQKPQAVIDRLSYFYQYENSNIHRAAHELAARATDAYEDARKTIQRFLNAASANEIVFTRGTTESINLVASSWGEQHLKEGDEIIISHLEHHANIVPWQLLAKKKGFKINVIPVDDDGQLILDDYIRLLNHKTKLVAFTHVSNALGTITQAKQIIELAHNAGAKVLLDGAQSVSHLKVDLQYLNPDFFVLSGHKIFGPTGIGVLYGKEELLNSLQPYQGGGNMIRDVTFERTLFHNAPNRFEAGTGNIADAVGLGAAIEYIQRIGIEHIGRYEHELLEYATYLFRQIPGLQLIGTATDKASVLSFTLKGYSNDEVGQILNQHGIAVRTGHHCAQPILRRLGHESSVRPSLAFYNTREEIDLLANVVYRLAGQRR